VGYILVFKPFPQAEKKVVELTTLNNVDRLDNGDETLKKRLEKWLTWSSATIHHTSTSRNASGEKGARGCKEASCWCPSISWGWRYLIQPFSLHFVTYTARWRWRRWFRRVEVVDVREYDTLHIWNIELDILNKKDNQTYGQRLHNCLKVMMLHWSAAFPSRKKWLISTASLEEPLRAGRSTGWAWTEGDGVEFAVATLERMGGVFLWSTKVKSNSLPDSGTLAIAAWWRRRQLRDWEGAREWGEPWGWDWDWEGAACWGSGVRRGGIVGIMRKG